MLTALSIRDVVLIEALDLAGEAGLCALTGETGAGKSILLGALGLALGGRAEAALVRRGAAQAAVTAAFTLPAGHPALALLHEKGIPAENEIILRRTVASDGKSRAFVNDTAATVQLLKDAGALLVEIHGQFDAQGLLDPSTHGETLDAFAKIDPAPLGKAWDTFRAASARLAAAKAASSALSAQEDYLRHAHDEIAALDPKPGEEAQLAEKRARLMNADRLRDAAAEAASLLEAEGGILALVAKAETLLEKAGATEALPPFARARAELEDAAFAVSRLDTNDAGNLAQIEDRYFALRAAAKKHRVTVDDLAALQQDLAEKLNLASGGGETLAELERAERAARKVYAELAETVSAKRKKSAEKLSKAVQAELPALKLEKAAFAAEVAPLPEENWGPAGADRVRFAVSTNPGAPLGPLHKIASGGELARFMLALKAALAGAGGAATLIFDEVDSGVSGATAAAVGARLARLAETKQVLVVTHSPQVAARAAHHWRVAKSPKSGTTVTPLSSLSERAEEIARMLSGAIVTKEARAQAQKLLEDKDAA